jgi:hypothetical protein
LTDQPEIEVAQTNFYHLAAGEVVFADPETEQSGVVRLNVMIVTPDGNIGVRHIGQAQQSLQLRFFERVENPKLQVVDVVLIGISLLGQMTNEEFHREPPGQQLREVPAEAATNLN